MSTSSGSDGSAAAANDTLAAACRDFVQSDTAAAQQSALTPLLLSLHGRRAELRDVVTSCAAFLTSEQETHRRRSVLLLAELLLRLPTMTMAPRSWRTLLAFFCDRLRDEPCWKESLMGISALLKRTDAAGAAGPDVQHLSAADATQLARALFDNVAVQSLAQSGRALALAALDLLCRAHPTAMVGLGEYAISGIIRCIDGEKDPRNLIVTFRLAAFIMAGGVQAPLPTLEEAAAAASTTAAPAAATAAPAAAVPPAVGRVSYPSALLHAYVEEVFELTSCYFPITFTPPPNDTVGITTVELRQALRHVFGCSGLMSEFVLSLLLEKMESSVTECKLDAIDTLRHCVTAGAYSIAHVDPFLPSIAAALKKEMMSGAGGEAVYTAAAATFSALVARLCPDQVAGFPAFHLAPSWSLLMEPLLREAEAELDAAPDSKTARSYASMLQLVCATSANAFTRTMKRLFALHVEAKFYAPHVPPSQRLALLELINLLVQTANQKYEFALPAHPLQPYAESILSMQGSVLVGGSAEQRAVAVEGMANLAALPAFQIVASSGATDAMEDTDASDAAAAASFTTAAAVAAAPASSTARVLSLAEVRSIVLTLTDRLLSDDHDLVRQHCLTGLVQLSRDELYRPLLIECTLPALFNSRTQTLLPSPAEDESESASPAAEMDDLQRQVAQVRSATLEDVLDASSALCRAAPLLDRVLPPLLHMVSAHFAAAMLAQSSSNSSSVLALHMLLSCLAEIVQANSASAEGRARLDGSVAQLSSALVGLVLHASLQLSGRDSGAALDAKTVSITVTILQAIARSADASTQQRLVDQMVALFLDGDVSAFARADVPVRTVPFAPLGSTTDANAAPAVPKSQLQLLPLFTAVLGSYRRDAVKVGRMDEILRRLLRFIDTPQTPEPAPASAAASTSAAPATVPAALSESQQSAIECVAALVNKLDNGDPLLSEFIDQQMQRGLLVRISDPSLDLSARRRAVTLLIWCTKALLMRSHARAGEFAQHVIQLLTLHSSAPEVAESVARGMGVLLMDATAVLNRESHAQCGPGQLYKQRFFVQHLPLLLSLFNGTPSTASSSSGAAPAASPRFVVLLALAHLLQHVPQKVLMDARSTLLPLLLQSLSSPQTELRIATLHTISMLLREDVECMSSHLDTMLPVITELMAYKQNMRVRLTCLECVSHLRRLPYEQLHPHRSRILAALARAADDHKRAVRQAATRARNQWYLLTQ